MDNIWTVVVLGALILVLLVLQIVHIVIAFRREDSLIGLSDREFEDKYLKSNSFGNSSFERNAWGSQQNSGGAFGRGNSVKDSAKQDSKVAPIRIPVKKSDRHREEEQQSRQDLERIVRGSNSLRSFTLDEKNSIDDSKELNISGLGVEKFYIKLKTVKNTEDDELE